MSSTKKTYSVTLPDGSTVEKTSTRVFTHALIRQNKGETGYFVNFASSLERATAESRVGIASRSHVEIVALGEDVAPEVDGLDALRAAMFPEAWMTGADDDDPRWDAR
jgi:hypothetical protein